MKRFFKGCAVVLMMASVAACHDEKPKTSPLSASGEPVPVKLMTLTREMMNQPVYASGQFTTNDETILAFKTGGVISAILVKEGEMVHKGQLLAKLDLTEINAGVDQAKLALEKAKRDYGRAVNLRKDSVATLEQMQNAKTALDFANKQMDAANFNLKFSEIRAVEDGYILKKFANEGQLAGPGTPVLMTNGAGHGTWVLKAGLSDNEWAKTAINDKAEITTDAMPGITLEGVVSSKAEGADPITGLLNVEVKVIAKQNLSLASGLFGKAKITPTFKSEVWPIPYEAFLDGNNNSGFVYVTRDRKTAHRIPVTIAGLDKSMVFVKSGLENETEIIVSGSAYLSDNAPIIIK